MGLRQGRTTMALPIRAFLVRYATLPSIEKMPKTSPWREK